jgi:hypothetical protein
MKVGYGDAFPRSLAGKIVGVITALGGIIGNAITTNAIHATMRLSDAQ